MYLTRHQTPDGPNWALDGYYLPRHINLKTLLALPSVTMLPMLHALSGGETAVHPLLPPLEPDYEVWAAGVTYRRSREAREHESDVKDVYQKVYSAKRPELFFKAIGWRVVGHKMPIRIRRDSFWNVPEPELTLVINGRQEIVGFCVGNDVSSRDIEGANPLYLPQAKIYNNSCALGPGILLAEAEQLLDLAIQMDIIRAGEVVYRGETRSSQMKRSLGELVGYLTQEMDFPYGAFLMTGTGLVPPEEFSLQHGDTAQITIGSLQLENTVHG
ncbi:MAG: fumarylacetoacetate hydrolase family protein [Anaerolineaceae bacterium]|nr:fumarylacetoacetate hydrolase family protein [Anaerolineaceae bacterium]